MTHADSPTHGTPEFIFGPLSTPEGRVQRARALNVGFQPAAAPEPIDPRPDEAVTITARAGLGVALEEATLHYTLDGSTPAADGATTQRLAMQRTRSDWDTLTWSTVETWDATIPGQPENTRVRYLITGRTTEGQVIVCPHIDANTPELRARPDAFDRRYLHRVLRQPAPQIFEFSVDRLEIPEWLRDAIIYQIFVDRFAPDPDKQLAEADRPFLDSSGARCGASPLGWITWATWA